MIKILFTFDYEVYGNGTGNLIDLVLIPTKKLLDTAGGFGAKITLFPEVAEFLAMRQEDLYKTDINAVENQLQKALKQGHDVQLHIHPQWENATFLGGRWKLNYENVSIAKLPYAKSLKVIKAGKYYLENLLKPIDPDYECLAFRAGYWCMMPSFTVLKALRAAEIRADSSVYKWGREQGVYVNYDYSLAHSHFSPWFADPQNINRASSDSNHILEIPIYTEKALISSMITKKRFSLRKLQKESLEDLQPDKAKRLLFYFNSICKTHPKKFDFCKLTFNEMAKMIDNIVKMDQENVVLPICAIGHSKEFFFDKDFGKLLSYITAKYRDLITFDTMQNAVSELVERDRKNG